jgi:hypothetical protein
MTYNRLAEWLVTGRDVGADAGREILDGRETARWKVPAVRAGRGGFLDACL